MLTRKLEANSLGINVQETGKYFFSFLIEDYLTECWRTKTPINCHYVAFCNFNGKQLVHHHQLLLFFTHLNAVDILVQ